MPLSRKFGGASRVRLSMVACSSCLWLALWLFVGTTFIRTWLRTLPWLLWWHNASMPMTGGQCHWVVDTVGQCSLHAGSWRPAGLALFNKAEEYCHTRVQGYCVLVGSCVCDVPLVKCVVWCHQCMPSSGQCDMHHITQQGLPHGSQ